MTRSDQQRILVVGAGMMGVNVAFAAANAGHKVTLVDQRDRGRIGGRLNLGAIRLCGQDPDRGLALALAARRYWETIAAYVPAIGFKSTGSVVLLRDQHDIESAYRYLAATEGRLSLSILVGREVASIEPSISGGFPAAIRCRDDARLEPGRAVGAMIEHLWLLDGVDARFSTRVSGVYSSGSAVTVVTSSGTIEADHVFVCSGSAALEHRKAVEGSLRRLQLQTIVGRAPSPLGTIVSDLRSLPISARLLGTADQEHHSPWVAVPTDGGSLVIGVAGPGAANDSEVDPSAAAHRLAWLQGVLGHTFGMPNGSGPPQVFTKDLVVHEEAPYVAVTIQPHVVAVAGLGLHATTYAPAVAHEILAALG